MSLAKSQKSLKKWSDSDWDYVNPSDKNKPKSQRGRYLPKSVRESLTPAQKAATNRKKKAATAQGKQNAKYSKDLAKKVTQASKVMKEGGKTPAWQRKEGKDPSGGLNRKGVASYRRANPGSKLKTAVTTKPSKLKPGSKAAKRRKSFCSRMKGMKAKLTSAKTANDPNSRINKSLRKWNCEDGGIIEMSKGGSTVNKAGNYTKPGMRKNLFNKIKAGSKGGNPGQWSARKAQMLAKQYKSAGGGYKEKGGEITVQPGSVKDLKNMVKELKKASKMHLGQSKRVASHVGMMKKKQKGGILSGPSHKKGGIPAIVAKQQPVELEGGEYIIRKSSVDKLGKKVLDTINQKGKIPMMKKGGQTNFGGMPGFSVGKQPVNLREMAKKINPNNKKSVMAFQKAAGLKVDGILGGNTLKKLRSVQGVKTSKASTEAINKRQKMLLKKKDLPITKSKAKKPAKKKTIPDSPLTDMKFRRDKKGLSAGQARTLAKRLAAGKKAFNPLTGKEVKNVGDIQKALAKPLTGKGKNKVDPNFKKSNLKSKFRKDIEAKQSKLKSNIKKSKASKALEAAKVAGKKRDKAAKQKAFQAKIDKEKAKRKKEVTPMGKMIKGLKSILNKRAKDKKVEGNSGVGLKFQDGGYMPDAPIPAKPEFRQGMRMMGHGGQTSTSNPNAGCGDVVTVHTHSGYQAGK
tara:strand:+ start:480 stop:2534 length:2055 start_codon:yes stop_codon:yes gene_type:complete